MKQQKVIDEFRAAHALLEGHFILSSGLHSEYYFQCARVMMDPERGARLCSALAEQIHEHRDAAALTRTLQPPLPIDMIVSPAMGGVVVGYEMGRQMKVPAVFFERVEGQLTLRRGFDIPKGTKCLIVEDIITTGGSAQETIEAVLAHGGQVLGVACLINRSMKRVEIGAELISLVHFPVPTYSSDDLPQRLQNKPAISPGSRNLR